MKSGKKKQRRPPSPEVDDLDDDDDDFLDIDTLKQFTIPKRKKVKRDLFESLSENSREFQNDILPIIRQSYRDRESAKYYQYSRPRLVHNEKLMDEYIERKHQMKSDGYSEKEILDTFCFLHVQSEHEVKKICEEGLKTSNTKISSLGDPTMGVYVCRHADIISSEPFTKSRNGILIAFKAIKGRIKFTVVTEESEAREPTPNFDCHMIKTSNINTSQMSALSLFNSMQMYSYEYTLDADLAERPRQVVPFAVISYRYQGMPSHEASRLALPVAPPQPRVKEKRKLNRNAAELKSKMAADGTSVDPSMLPGNQDQSVIGSDLMSEETILWSGVLKIKEEFTECVELVGHFSSLIDLTPSGSTLTMERIVSVDVVREFYLSKGGKFDVSSSCRRDIDWCQAYARLRPAVLLPQSLNKFSQLTTHLNDNQMAGFVEMNYGNTHILLVPVCKASTKLGLTTSLDVESGKSRPFLHCVFISKSSCIECLQAICQSKALERSKVLAEAAELKESALKAESSNNNDKTEKSSDVSADNDSKAEQKSVESSAEASACTSTVSENSEEKSGREEVNVESRDPRLRRARPAVIQAQVEDETERERTDRLIDRSLLAKTFQALSEQQDRSNVEMARMLMLKRRTAASAVATSVASSVTTAGAKPAAAGASSAAASSELTRTSSSSSVNNSSSKTNCSASPKSIASLNARAGVSSTTSATSSESTSGDKAADMKKKGLLPTPDKSVKNSEINSSNSGLKKSDGEELNKTSQAGRVNGGDPRVREGASQNTSAAVNQPAKFNPRDPRMRGNQASTVSADQQKNISSSEGQKSLDNASIPKLMDVDLTSKTNTVDTGSVFETVTSVTPNNTDSSQSHTGQNALDSNSTTESEVKAEVSKSALAPALRDKLQRALSIGNRVRSFHDAPGGKSDQTSADAVSNVTSREQAGSDNSRPTDPRAGAVASADPRAGAAAASADPRAAAAAGSADPRAAATAGSADPRTAAAADPRSATRAADPRAAARTADPRAAAGSADPRAAARALRAESADPRSAAAGSAGTSSRDPRLAARSDNQLKPSTDSVNVVDQQSSAVLSDNKSIQDRVSQLVADKDLHIQKFIENFGELPKSIVDMKANQAQQSGLSKQASLEGGSAQSNAESDNLKPGPFTDTQANSNLDNKQNATDVEQPRGLLDQQTSFVRRSEERREGVESRVDPGRGRGRDWDRDRSRDRDRDRDRSRDRNGERDIDRDNRDRDRDRDKNGDRNRDRDRDRYRDRYMDRDRDEDRRRDGDRDRDRGNDRYRDSRDRDRGRDRRDWNRDRRDDRYRQGYSDSPRSGDRYDERRGGRYESEGRGPPRPDVVIDYAHGQGFREGGPREGGPFERGPREGGPGMGREPSPMSASRDPRMALRRSPSPMGESRFGRPDPRSEFQGGDPRFNHQDGRNVSAGPNDVGQIRMGREPSPMFDPRRVDEPNHSSSHRPDPRLERNQDMSRDPRTQQINNVPSDGVRMNDPRAGPRPLFDPRGNPGDNFRPNMPPQLMNLPPGISNNYPPSGPPGMPFNPSEGPPRPFHDDGGGIRGPPEGFFGPMGPQSMPNRHPGMLNRPPRPMLSGPPGQGPGRPQGPPFGGPSGPMPGGPQNRLLSPPRNTGPQMRPRDLRMYR